MTQGHLSDTEIQKAVFDSETVEASIQEHLLSCEFCRLQASFYREEFAAIREIERPVFDFDLAGSIMAGIIVPERNKRPIPFFFILFTLVALCSGVAFWMFRKYLYNMFTGFSLMIIYLLAATACTFLIFQVIEINRKYQQKINALNFY